MFVAISNTNLVLSIHYRTIPMPSQVDADLQEDMPPRTCDHNEAFFIHPPALSVLNGNFPDLAPNAMIDRTIRRCKLCDLFAATQEQLRRKYLHRVVE